MMKKLLSAFTLSRLRRVTSGESYVPEIDGVRFVAIACVLVQHIHERVLRRSAEFYPDVAEHFFYTAGTGVSVFFALSGLILYRGLKNAIERRGSVDLKPYFWRRITRLEPPYVVVMTAIFLYMVLIGYNSEHVRRLNSGPESLLVSYLASLTYTHCLIFGSLPRLNGVAWSLEIEVQYYLLAPLLAVLIHKSGMQRRALWLLVIALVWAFFVTPLAFGNLHSRYSLLTSLPYFLVGMSIEELRRAPVGSLLKRSQDWIADCIGLFSFLTLIAIHLPQSSGLSASVKTILVMLTLWGMLNGLAWRRFLSVPFVSVVGGMCYSIYLIHMPVLEVCANVITRLGRGLPYPVYVSIQGVLLLTAVLIASAVLYVLVERPCMKKNWPSDLYHRLRGP